MIRKYLICPERCRRIPSSFSWVDHRLVRDRHISRCSSEALALYLFLVTVADAQGLSYYSDSSLGKYLTMRPQTVKKARSELGIAGLIAYQEPLYQVLGLELPTGPPSRLSSASSHSKTIEKISKDNEEEEDQPPMSPVPRKPPTPTIPPTLLENNFPRSKKITPIGEMINSIIEGNSR